jgi:dimethylaniline monooxygenase (N-oxide forming)
LRKWRRSPVSLWFRFDKDSFESLTALFSSGTSKEETFDYVLFCGGHHADPNWPKPWPGQEEFQGRILHSHSYKHSGGFEEKVNVGVGIGNSGVDVACDLSCVSKQVGT